MSSVRCPYCQFTLELKRAKPGRFEPACPSCKTRFVLTVPTNGGGIPTAAPLKPKKTTEAKPATVDRTVAPAPITYIAPEPLSMPEVHSRLGGYHILQKLGYGSMGAVYLARQASLDREVALKVLSPELSADPRFMSRFARQAYAAAQLNHPNLVPIYEIGPGFFSMQFIEGQTLAVLLKGTEKLEPEVAVGYALQAARGLKFAHDHGLLHRDIKPANLLLDDQGIIKVVDLGLVQRTALVEETQLSISIGSPAYMAPEQARNAAGVDARADIYSLGCTLYKLLTGQRPFTGMDPKQLLTQHATEPVVPPDRVNSAVPAPLSLIVAKMLAKRPADRYPNMSETITALEGWLGVNSGRPFAPKPEQVKRLESAASRFNASKWKLIRTICIRTFLVLSTIAIVALALPTVGYSIIAAGLIGFVLTTVVAYQLLLGVARRTFLVVQLREFILRSNFVDVLTYLIFIASGIVLLLAFDLHWLWLAFAIGATALAGMFFGTVDTMLAKDREPPIAETLALLKELRLQGLSENSVRQFVCKYAGRDWEEFYEELFGFEAKLLARQAWGQGDTGQLRPCFASWREPIVSWMEHHIQLRKDARQRRMLTPLESKAIIASGVEPRAARKKARFNARRVVEKAAVIRATARLRSAETALPNYARAAIQFNDQVRAITTDWVHDDSRAADEHSPRYRRKREVLRHFRIPLDILFGQTARLIVSVVILGGFGMWRNSNGGLMNIQSSLHPLRIMNVPNPICDAVGSWNGGLVGTLLLISTMFSGTVLGLAVVGAAAIGLFGQRWNVQPLANNPLDTAITAGLLWLIALFFLKPKKEFQ